MQEIESLWGALGERDQQAVLQLARTLAAMARQGLVMQSAGLRAVVASWHDSVFGQLVTQEVWGDEYASAVALGGVPCSGGERERP